MKLEEALLCVDCESLYPISSHCPQCGSRVSYPISRALNRSAASAVIPCSSSSAREAAERSRPVAGMSGPALRLLRSA